MLSPPLAKMDDEGNQGGQIQVRPKGPVMLLQPRDFGIDGCRVGCVDDGRTGDSCTAMGRLGAYSCGVSAPRVFAYV